MSTDPANSGVHQAGASQSSMQLSLDLPRRRMGAFTTCAGLPHRRAPERRRVIASPSSRSRSRIRRAIAGIRVPIRRSAVPIENRRPESFEHRPNRASASRIVESLAQSSITVPNRRIAGRFDYGRFWICALANSGDGCQNVPHGAAGGPRGASGGLVTRLRCLHPRFSRPEPS